MLNYDKTEIRSQLTLENIFELVNDWGGDPILTPFGFISSTICHNKPGEGSKKLYYYENSGLFQCYTGCQGYFDIFELLQKIMKIQHNIDYDLNDAVRWIATKFGLSGSEKEDSTNGTGMEDWVLISNYSRLREVVPKEKMDIRLAEYNNSVLNHFNYKVLISPWIEENISRKAMQIAKIGFYPGGNQITIPHYDKDSRLVGIRGRTLSTEDAEKYGKYRPIKVGSQLYNHPLGMNLYNLNLSKKNIKNIKKAVIFESEKSCLLYKTYFGEENDISVACCGSNLSNYQIQLLVECGAEEIIVAFDRQFQEIGDKEFKHLVKGFRSIHSKYKNYVKISFIFDKNLITNYKASPIDEGKEKFLELFKRRVIL